KVVVAGEIVGADAAFAVHQHEARAVCQAAIHAVQLEAGAAQLVETRHFAGQEIPAGGVGFEEGGVFGEHGRRVVRRIHGEADQLHFGRTAGGILDAAHL